MFKKESEVDIMLMDYKPDPKPLGWYGARMNTKKEQNIIKINIDWKAFFIGLILGKIF